jgi:hypothetical protein
VGLPSRDRLTYELQVTEERIREIDFKIMELKKYRASILGRFFFTDFDRMEIARIDARIAETGIYKRGAEKTGKLS